MSKVIVTILIVVLVLVLGLIGYIVWLVYEASHKRTSKTNGFFAHKDKNYPFSFDYVFNAS